MELNQLIPCKYFMMEGEQKKVQKKKEKKKKRNKKKGSFIEKAEKKVIRLLYTVTYSVKTYHVMRRSCTISSPYFTLC